MPSVMTKPVARPRGPLDGRALPRGEDFRLAVSPAAGRILLRGDAAVAARASAAFGAPLPTRSGAVGARSDRAALWLGPDEWLLIAEGEAPAEIIAPLSAALADRAHSLVDVSQRQIGLDVVGPNAARALTAGCPLDLSLAAFPVGTATRTLLAKSEIVLWRRAPEHFRVEVWRSFADYVASYLSEAARRAPRAGGFA